MVNGTKARFYFVQVIDPFVTIEVFGIPADISQERTRTVPHNGTYFTTVCFDIFGSADFEISFWPKLAAYTGYLTCVCFKISKETHQKNDFRF